MQFFICIFLKTDHNIKFLMPEGALKFKLMLIKLGRFTPLKSGALQCDSMNLTLAAAVPYATFTRQGGEGG